MPNIDILVLAIIQGVTEFLPVGSTGHLILIPQFYCWPDHGLALEVVLYLGSLIALALYFWRDLLNMGQGAAKVLGGKRDPRVRLIGLLLVATVPMMGAAYAADRYLGEALNDPVIVVGAMVGFAILLYGADKLGLTVRRVEHMTWGNALVIGVFQCLAVIPGASRVGVAITVARIMGFERPDAARFSLLVSIPILAAAGLYKGWQLLQVAEAPTLQFAGFAVALAAICGLLAISFLMYWLRRAGFAPFVLYRIAAGLFVLYVFFGAGGPTC